MNNYSDDKRSRIHLTMVMTWYHRSFLIQLNFALQMIIFVTSVLCRTVNLEFFSMQPDTVKGGKT